MLHIYAHGLINGPNSLTTTPLLFKIRLALSRILSLISNVLDEGQKINYSELVSHKEWREGGGRAQEIVYISWAHKHQRIFVIVIA